MFWLQIHTHVLGSTRANLIQPGYISDPLYVTCISPHAVNAVCPRQNIQFKSNKLSIAQSDSLSMGFLPKTCRHQTIPDKWLIFYDGTSKSQKGRCPDTLRNMAAKPLHQSVHSLRNSQEQFEKWSLTFTRSTYPMRENTLLQHNRR